jgi:hypothetical protein
MIPKSKLLLETLGPLSTFVAPVHAVTRRIGRSAVLDQSVAPQKTPWALSIQGWKSVIAISGHLLGNWVAGFQRLGTSDCKRAVARTLVEV